MSIPNRAVGGAWSRSVVGRRRRSASAIGWAAACWAGGATAAAWGQAHPAGVPQLASRPGAAYTIYLDLDGFSFTGGWGGSGNGQPGVIRAYDGAVNGVTASDQGYISQIWSGIAEKYAAFNVNVTTIDPAVAAGHAATDAARQAYYDQTGRLMHTVIGDTSFTAAGVSYVGVTPYTYGTGDNNGAGDGFHTNFVTPTGTGGEFGVGGIVGAASHEDGHGFGLNHQADYDGSGGLVNDYSSNDNAQGNGSVSPVMGVTYYSQRGVWRQGKSDQNQAVQNDVAVIANDGGNGLSDDGVGHTTAAATALPTTGTTVNFAAAHGVIIPTTAANPNPIGAANYTADVYAFNATGAAVSLTVHNGGSKVMPGTVDASPTLASSASILSASGAVLYTAAENFATQAETIAQALPAGRYYLQVNSAGGQVGAADATAGYFDMGSYFVTGTGVTGQSVGTYYWQGGASTAKWSQVDGSASNWRGEHAAGTDKGAAPAAADNVFLSVDAGATNLNAMTLGGSRTVNSLTFTGTGTTAATTGVTIGADGSTLTLAPYAGHIDASAAGVASGVGIVVQAGAAANAVGANVALAVGQTWQVNNAAANPLTVSGVVSGATGAGLTVTGGGRVTLTASNTYTGGTYVNGSTVGFAAGSLGAGPVTLTNNGILQFAAGNAADPTAAGTTVTVIAGGGQIDTNGNTATIAGGVVDPFVAPLTKLGSGTLGLGASGTAVNPTNLFVRGGTLAMGLGSTITTAPVTAGTGNQYVSVGQAAGDAAALVVNAGCTLTAAGDLNVGDVSATGTVTVQSSGTVNARTLYVGKYGSSGGTVVQQGGVVQEADNGAATSDWRIGGGGSAADAAAVGAYDLNGGSLNTGSANLQVGAYGTGTLAVVRGSATVGGFLSIGRFAGSVGTVDLSAGSGTLTANAANKLIVGEQGTGTLKVGGTSVVTADVLEVALSDGTAATGSVVQTGGTVNATGGVVFGGQASGSAVVSATYTLGGGTAGTGTLYTPSVGQGTGGTNVTGTFHFAGGTLAPTASTTTLMQGLTRADVRAGGAVFDTGSYAVTVAQPLLHDATVTGPDGGLTKVGAGTLTLAGTEAYTGPTNVSAGTLTFAANPAGGGIRRQPLPGGVTVAAGATATLARAAAAADRTLLVPTGLSVAGRFDVANDDVDVVGGSLPALTAAAAAGFAGGTWAGPTGLVSSAAAADAARLTAVGVILNTAAGTTPIYPTFDGRPAAASDVLVRYTEYGDADLSGTVTAADYSRVDNGFVMRLTGWANGDFNYDGVVDGSDYTLMDNSFDRQTGSVGAPAAEVADMVASPTALLAGSTAAVPEPAAVAMLVMAATGGLLRRRAN